METERILLGVWIGGKLTRENLADLAMLSRENVEIVYVVVEESLATDATVKPLDRASLIASLSTMKFGHWWQRVGGDGRQLLDNKVVDAVVFVGFLNDNLGMVKEVSPFPRLDNAQDVLTAFVIGACQAGKDVLVLEDKLSWNYAPVAQLKTDRDPKEAAREYRRVCSYAGKKEAKQFSIAQIVGNFTASMLTRRPSLTDIADEGSRPSR